MAALAVVITAAMIRIVSRRVPVWLACELCGEDASYIVESDEGLCGSCLVERRHVYRVQLRPVLREKARLEAQGRVDAPRYDRWLRDNWEGESSASELAQDGYWDVLYEEFVGSETVGPKARGVVEVTPTNEVQVSANPEVVLTQGVWDVTSFISLAQREIERIRERKQVPDEIVKHDASRRATLLGRLASLGTRLYVKAGFRDVVVMYDGVEDDDVADDVLRWLHRDPSDKAVLSRWHRDEDELAFMDSIRDGSAFTHPGDRDAVDVDPEDEDLDDVDGEFEYVHGEEHRFGQRALTSGREAEWWELMVAFRRQKLHGLLQEYFGLDDYRTESIVLKWEKTPAGRWKPAEQMNVVEWVEWSQEQAGSILGGLQSCTRSIQVKTQLRKRKEARAVNAAA